jgi:hypothetical protein
MKNLVLSSFNKAVKKANDLKEDNNITLAVVTLVSFFKKNAETEEEKWMLAEWQKALEGIESIHLYLGSITTELMSIRLKLIYDLEDFVEKNYGKEVRNKINRCF